MSAERNRPGGETQAAQKAFDCAGTSVPDTRPRCNRCHHPLTAPRSVARSHGPRCWTRTALGRLDRRRDHIGRGLGSLARRVARLDTLGLALVGAWLADVAEALDNAEGVSA